MVNSPLIRPYLLGGALGGNTLDSHDFILRWTFEGSPCGHLVAHFLKPVISRRISPLIGVYITPVTPLFSTF